MLDRASETCDLMVITAEEGAQLGFVSDVFIDTQTRCVAAFGTRRRRIGGGEYFVAASEVRLVGRDVLLVSNVRAMTRVTGATEPPGRSLTDLRGTWVTTMDGVHLGTLADVEFAAGDWGVSELILADDRRLPVDRAEIRIADEILVPVEYAERLEKRKESRPGLLARVFRREVVDDTREVVRRTLPVVEPGEAPRKAPAEEPTKV
jgi:sporulation protein YlmC with PRC-barrel domain